MSNRITFLPFFATLLTVYSMAYVWAITFWPIPTSGTRFADTILGFLLGTMIATLLNYYFGTSSGSKDKDATISGMLNSTLQSAPVLPATPAGAQPDLLSQPTVK